MTSFPARPTTVTRPDILILEGLNVLQTSRPDEKGLVSPVVSDFFDFSIYVDADEAVIERWYVERFKELRQTAFRDPQSYFRRYADLDDATAETMAREIWRSINLAEFAPEHPAHPASRRSHSAQGAEPSDRGSGAASLVTTRLTA